MKVYILCKNEESNIRKCIESLLDCGMSIILMDSGSSDNTLSIASRYPVKIIHYKYTNHCDAYNFITTRESDCFCGVFDADMEMTINLAEEILIAIKENDVVLSPVRMYVDGVPLKYGSLCPPKPIVFRSGKAYFESVGHGERLVGCVRKMKTKNLLIHNDLKDYLSYLKSQVRYAERLAELADSEQLTWRDRVRIFSPLMIALTPMYSLLVKGGIFYRAGWIYAIDRLIAEAIMYKINLRRSLLKI